MQLGTARKLLVQVKSKDGVFGEDTLHFAKFTCLPPSSFEGPHSLWQVVLVHASSTLRGIGGADRLLLRSADHLLSPDE